MGTWAEFGRVKFWEDRLIGELYSGRYLLEVKDEMLERTCQCKEGDGNLGRVIQVSRRKEREVVILRRQKTDTTTTSRRQNARLPTPKVMN